MIFDHIQRRFLTILFLLLPSILAFTPGIASLRPPTENDNTSQSPIAKLRTRIARFVASPLGQTLPEMHMVLFLCGGRFFEFGRRVTGLRYVRDVKLSNYAADCARFRLYLQDRPDSR
jgi:peroxin-10